jgi:geranylgeranyl transferase type-2 subunit beta
MLDVGDERLWKRAAEFLRRNAPAPAEATDVLSLLLTRSILEARGLVVWCQACAAARLAELHAALERFRASPAGFARTVHGTPSLYHTFLAALSCELLGEAMSGTGETVRLVLSRECPHGGFGDVQDSNVAGTNPTAAAVGLLLTLGALDAPLAARAAEFILTMQRPDGGFAAHPSAPGSDLMSTFTALVTLVDTHAVRRARLADAGRFVKTLAFPSGGFLAVREDDAPDVEYTFYGLAALALLADELPACAARGGRAPGHRASSPLGGEG